MQIVGRLEVSRLQVNVDPEGIVNVPPLGAIQVGGLTLLEANRRIADRARSLLRFPEVSVSVIAPRAFEVIVSGEVERPGTIQVVATQRLHEVLLTTGGVTPRGSVRHVQVIERGARTEVDLLRFELLGDVDQNPFVREGMRVHVPPRGAAVVLAGAVRRPGEYELGPTRSLREVLDLTGGLAHTVPEARLTRVGPDGRKETVSLDLRAILDAGGDVRLQAGDAVFVPAVASLQDVVEVRGAFAGTPDSGKSTVAGKATVTQRLELARGDRVTDVVRRAGGPAPHADLRLAFVDRGSAIGPSQRIPIDLHRVLVDRDATHDIALHNGDVLVLPVADDRVYVVGEVKNPGPQDFRPDFTPREYVAMAGGPGTRARVAETTVTLRDGRTYPMSEAPPLEPGAVVTVPEVAVRWWQDYVQIATAIGSLLTAYTGLFVIFHGPLN
jgi:polysaccharide export outer membrane protein